MPEKAPLAVVTMAYDDVDYLGIWLGYWRRHLPEEHLHVILDGPNPELEAMAEGCMVTVRDRPEPHDHMEDERWVMLADFAADLLERYKVVVYTDVDEIIVADPKARAGVVELLSNATAPVRNTKGIEILHRRDREPDVIDLTQPILTQRQHYRATSRFSKPCIISEPVRWSRGGHMVNRRSVNFVPGLYTVHLRFYDAARFLERTRRRRQSTKAPTWLDKLPYRKWRSSEEHAQALIDGFDRMPVLPGRSLWPMSVQARMKLTLPRDPDANGFYPYVTRDSKVVQRLPKRFLQLF